MKNITIITSKYDTSGNSGRIAFSGFPSLNIFNIILNNNAYTTQTNVFEKTSHNIFDDLSSILLLLPSIKSLGKTFLITNPHRPANKNIHIKPSTFITISPLDTIFFVDSNVIENN